MVDADVLIPHGALASHLVRGIRRLGGEGGTTDTILAEKKQAMAGVRGRS